MVMGLGLHPDQPGKFILLSIITSLTYMSIVSFLAIALDNVGRFLAMLLLVLQLGATANLMLLTALRIHGNRRFQHESIDA